MEGAERICNAYKTVKRKECVRHGNAFSITAAVLTLVLQSVPVSMLSGEEAPVASGLARTALQVDVDVFDNQTVPKSHYGAPFYGTREIDALFEKCRSNGVTRATWRAMCQIASYRSALNYTVADVPRIRSNADSRRAEGAFAAKIAVGARRAPTLPELRRLPFGGLAQRVENDAPDTFVLRGAVSSRALPPPSRARRLAAWLGLARPSAAGAFLAAADAASGRVFARGPEVASEAFQTSEIRFAASAPFYVGVFSYGRPDLHVFVADALSLQDGVGRERLANGGMEETDELLEPAGWRASGAAFVTLNGDFRAMDATVKTVRFPKGNDFYKLLDRPYTEELFTKAIEEGDPLAIAGKAAQRNGVTLYAWFDLFDDGRRALPPVQAWSSKFLEEHPECRAIDREGRTRWGLLCFGYPEVRAQKTSIVKELLSYEGVAGVALKTHFQHNRIYDGNSHDYARYLYNDVALAAYHTHWGEPADGVYDTYRLRMVYGDFAMQWLREIRPLFERSGKRLCLFLEPVSMLDVISGGWVLRPERLIEEGLCDELLIEPRSRGDAVETVRTNARIQALVDLCRRKGVAVGFDYYLPGIPAAVKPAARGAYMRDQVLALAQEGFDFVGVYEELCLVRPDIWPKLGEASQIIQASPPRALWTGRASPPPGRNVFSVFDGGCAWCRSSNDVRYSVSELLDGDASDRSSVVFEHWPVLIELTTPRPAPVSRVILQGGYLSWVNQCAPEDFRMEASVDGVWLVLAEEKGAATRNRHVNTLPFVCRFKQVTTDRLRVTVTLGSDKGGRYLVLRELAADLEAEMGQSEDAPNRMLGPLLINQEG